MLPAFALLSVFSLAPLVYGAFLSLHSWDGFRSPSFIGLDNYARLITTDMIARRALVNTAVFALGVVIAKNVIALAIAMALTKVVRFNQGFRVASFLPVTFSIVVVGLLWTWFYSPIFGLFNDALRAVGLGSLTRSWLSDPLTALPSLMLVDIWKWTGFHTVIYFAALINLPSEVLEAAEIDGASGWTKFWRVTLPLLAPITFINVLLALSGAFVRSFDLVQVMTGGGPNHATEVVLTRMMTEAFQFGNLGYATAMGYTLSLFTAIVAGVYLWYARAGVSRT